VTILLANLNPLLPTDGYHAIEALWGGLNFQRRAFSLLLRLATFRPLPPHLGSLGRGERRTHLVYAVMSLTYVALFVGTVVYQIVQKLGS
jgi:putative peptide zinc metalloprotease protein